MPTLSSDPLDILLAFDAWATRTLLEPCRGLSREQFHQRFEIGLGSLHDNFTHIVGVMRRWTDRLAARPLRPALAAIPGRADIPHDARDRTPDDLLALLDDAAKDLASVARDIRANNRLGTTIEVQWPGEGGKLKTYTFSRGCILVHICTHGTHHRAQCLNMLRHLNVSGVSDKLPDPSTVDWQAETESPPVLAA